jgi:hypothetical protein
MSEYVYFNVTLPSKCLVYKDVDPTKIQIRTLKGEDEKLIAEISSDNFDKKYNMVLTKVFKGVDPLKLTLGDRFYLVLWETINSYSKDFPVEHECDQCWKKSTHIVDLSKLEIMEIPDGYKEPCEITLPKSGTNIKLRLLTVQDLIEIDAAEKNNQNVWLYRPALSIVNNKPVSERLEYVGGLDTQDVEYIRGFQDAFEHGVKMRTNYTCPKCGGVGEMPVPFQFTMLLSYGETLKRRVGDAIRSHVLPPHVDK